ncbi:PREDICTED: sufE-like protein 1, chloroplastic/mitochondrial [Camelina sativa]|uniref:SufE-like protein 1, chloroplastic/mitochondrial n=1 Tax=Camelina sativa TaxID=90675 RepID=A0ABM0XPR5_CAMSA|nr:PREDICTED: sufE-like protein 1, chloroplastic/mitochondrial [Camelina sativa]
MSVFFFLMWTSKSKTILIKRSDLCSSYLFASSVQYPAKALILRLLKPSELPLFRWTIITFQKISTGNVRPPSASSPSSSEDFQPIEELPLKLQEIVKLFLSGQEPRAKYMQLIFYEEHLKPLEPRFKTRENKVEDCVSQVWVRDFFDDQHNVVYEADSDSSITKGLAALLVQGLSGRPVPEILRVTPDFALLLGLQQSLSPSRNNGFLNMLKLMQKKALHLEVKGEEDSSSGESLESSFVPTPETNGGESFVVDKEFSAFVTIRHRRDFVLFINHHWSHRESSSVLVVVVVF